MIPKTELLLQMSPSHKLARL